MIFANCHPLLNFASDCRFPLRMQSQQEVSKQNLLVTEDKAYYLAALSHFAEYFIDLALCATGILQSRIYEVNYGCL
jgi:hypothetical protein